MRAPEVAPIVLELIGVDDASVRQTVRRSEADERRGNADRGDRSGKAALMGSCVADTVSAKLDVEDSVAPSGARTLISNCAWSSTGKKFLPTNIKSGTVLTITSTDNSTIAQRCCIDHWSIQVYVRSMGR